MQKPVIFFSHSGADKASLLRLKELFVAKTGGAIDVFLSSDGQSIPLGRNWVHRVEAAMKGSELMVIFLTQAALTSGWVYFEGGYAYSKGVRVVPVGFLGIDLSNVSPPLSLLQGFNITNADGLNNLVAIANEQFKHKHAENFTRGEFEEIQALGGIGERVSTGNLLGLIDDVNLRVPFGALKVKAAECLSTIAKVFKSHKIPHSVYQNRLLAAGFLGYTMKDPAGDGFDVIFVVDPLLLPTVFPITLAVLERIANEQHLPKWTFNTVAGVDIVNVPYKVAARLKDRDVTFTDDAKFRFRDIQFETGVAHTRPRPKSYISLVLRSSKVSVTDVVDLILLLHDTGVVLKPSSPFEV